MLFLIYWEFNEQVTPVQHAEAMKKLTQAELFPPNNINIIRFDVTPAGWGSSLQEAESVADIVKSLAAWRMACPGIFQEVKVSPAIPAEEALAEMEEIIKKLEQSYPVLTTSVRFLRFNKPHGVVTLIPCRLYGYCRIKQPGVASREH